MPVRRPRVRSTHGTSEFPVVIEVSKQFRRVNGFLHVPAQDEILDHLVIRIVDILPISAAGVTLISPGSIPR